MRIAMLISGGGTTMAAVIKACQEGRLKNVEPVLVIASRADTGGIQKALDLRIPKEDILIIRPKDFTSPLEFGEAILKECQKRKVDFVGQYGWLAKTPENVIKTFEGMMTNQHPGPLDPGRPDFGGAGMYGKRVHAARLLFVRKTNHDFYSEATAQRVAVDFDHGAILRSKQVPILETDTVEDLQARLLPAEHEVQIEVLQDFANGTVKEIKRAVPLVKPEEYQILEECKVEAIRLYPKG